MDASPLRKEPGFLISQCSKLVWISGEIEKSDATQWPGLHFDDVTKKDLVKILVGQLVKKHL